MKAKVSRESSGMTLIELLGAIAVTAVIATIAMAVITSQLQALLREKLAQSQEQACQQFAQRLQHAIDRRMASVRVTGPWLDVVGDKVTEGTRLQRLSLRTFDESGNICRLTWEKRPDAWHEEAETIGQAGALIRRRLGLQGAIVINLEPAAYSADTLPRSLSIRFPDSASISSRRGFAIYLHW